MDASLLSQMQSQEAATDDDEAAVNARLEAHSMDLHTALPGRVVSYDAATQTAVCQPGIQVIFRATGPVDLPQLVDVPVYFPRGGGFVLTFPVRVGDECLLVFAERAIDVWWQKGGTQVPVSTVGVRNFTVTPKGNFCDTSGPRDILFVVEGYRYA